MKISSLKKYCCISVFLILLLAKIDSATSSILSIGGIYAADMDQVDKSYEAAVKGAIRGVAIRWSTPICSSQYSFLVKGIFDVNRNSLKTSHPQLGEVKVRTKSIYSIGAGVGYSVTPSLMPYVIGGLRKIKKSTQISQTVYSDKLCLKEGATDEEKAQNPNGYASYEKVGKVVEQLTQLRHLYPFAEIGISYKLHERVSTTFSIRHTFFGPEKTPFLKKSNPHTTAFISILYHFF